MADRIELTGVEVYGYHGVFPHEKRDGQRFLTDVVVWTDFRQAAATDDLTYTISYADIADLIHNTVGGPSRDLIEAVASEIADILILNNRVHAVEVTIHKPDAPIPHPFADVAVVARRSRKDLRHVVLSFGSNITADGITPRQRVERAMQWFETSADYRVISTSSLYTTPAWGGVAQDDFMNSVAVVETMKTPHSILDDAHELERGAHRTRDVRWGPRTLDIDLITSINNGSEEHYDTNDLMLPHPWAHQRAFVLKPWLEVEPHARLGRHSIASLIESLDSREVEEVKPQ
ncbi:dihydroneopterin aldolase [uncultured Corynebacterium sp.]|uniref:dihydroneopterin aldolase n=1 Tax=uncultured Corynebacterium sp. TaxID=159447 RepID=UPI00344DE668